MSLLREAVVVLTALCCNSPVRSDPIIFSKNIEYPNQRLIIGQNHVDKSASVYASCASDFYERTADCLVEIEIDLFDQTKSSVYSWTVSLSTEWANGKLLVLGVDLWGTDKVLLSWRDVDNNDSRQARVTIRTLHINNSGSRSTGRQSQKIHKLTVDNRNDMKPQIFIIPSENTYIVSFKNKDLCDSYFCKMTVHENGEASTAIPWFPYTDFIHALGPTENHRHKLLITVGDILQDDGSVRYYLLDDTDRVEVKTSYFVEDVGWSTSNGIISFCTQVSCQHFNQEGVVVKTIRLQMQHPPTVYKALYNLPKGGYLAMICDASNSYYRSIKIGVNGHEEESYDLRGYRCSRKPWYMTSKFFIKSNTEYCLSLFYADYSYNNGAKFKIYCFPSRELLF